MKILGKACKLLESSIKILEFGYSLLVWFELEFDLIITKSNLKSIASEKPVLLKTPLLLNY